MMRHPHIQTTQLNGKVENMDGVGLPNIRIGILQSNPTNPTFTYNTTYVSGAADGKFVLPFQCYFNTPTSVTFWIEDPNYISLSKQSSTFPCDSDTTTLEPIKIALALQKIDVLVMGTLVGPHTPLPAILLHISTDPSDYTTTTTTLVNGTW